MATELKVGDVVIYKADRRIEMVVIKVPEGNGNVSFSFYNGGNHAFEIISLPAACVEKKHD